ncbi:MAG: hypothetical protein ACI8RD_006778 [Bacillariaceae sp.]|jgi:hypothetical protein
MILYFCCILLFLDVVTSFSVDFSDAPINKRTSSSVSTDIPSSSSSSSLSRSDELGILSLQLSKKTIGSSRYLRLWRRWSNFGMDIIRDELKTNNLPHPIDNNAKLELDNNLGYYGADLGRMPVTAFSNRGARSGYAVNLFCRISLLADLLVTCNHNNTDGDGSSSLPPHFTKGIRDLLSIHDHHNNHDTSENDVNNEIETETSKTCHLVSIGGACGYDYVSLALVATFHSSWNPGSSSTSSPVIVQATVFDYEEGWEDLIHAMSVSTSTALQYYDNNNNTNHNQNHSCTFGGKCDITKSLLSDPVNAAMSTREVLDKTDLYTCQYCVAENAVELRESNFIFFTELFNEAKIGSMFVFTETTHRLWPELLDVALVTATTTMHTEEQPQGEDQKMGTVSPFSFEAGFPGVGGRNKTGRQMVLRKIMKAEEEAVSAVTKNNTISCNDVNNIQILCEEFRRDNRMHEQRLKNGIVRQKKKRSAVGNK